MNENFAAKIATLRNEALTAAKATGSEAEEGLAHGYALVQDRITSAAALIALAEGAKQNYRETRTKFAFGVSLAASRTVEMLDEMLRGA